MTFLLHVQTSSLTLNELTLLMMAFDNMGELPGGSDGERSACNVGEPALVPELRRSPREGNGYPLPYSCLENSISLSLWASLIAQLVKNPPVMQETWVHSLNWEDPLEREWIPTPVFWPVEFHGLQRVGQDWMTLTFTLTIWLRLLQRQMWF